MRAFHQVAVVAALLCAAPALATDYSSEVLTRSDGTSIFVGQFGRDGGIYGQSTDLLPIYRALDGAYVTVPTPGGPRGTLRGVRADGSLVGSGRTGGGVETNRVFIRTGAGDVTILGQPADASWTVATAVGAGGVIAGTSTLNSGQTRAVVWGLDNIVRVLDVPTGFRRTQTHDINADGVVVGTANGGVGGAKAVRWSADGAATVLAGLGGQSIALGLNDAGLTVGNVYASTPDADGNLISFGAVWDAAGILTRVDPLAGDAVLELSAVNNAGFAVGFSGSYDANGLVVGRGVIWSAVDGLRPLMVQGRELDQFSPYRIDDRGRIIATSTNDSADLPAILLTPTAVPEATTWAMLVAGFGLVGGALRARGGGRTKPISVQR